MDRGLTASREVPHDETKRLDGPFDVDRPDVPVGHQSDHSRCCHGPLDVLAFQPLLKLGSGNPQFSHVDAHHVGLYRFQVDGKARDLPHTFCEPAGIDVVFCHTINHRLQGHDAWCRDPASLAHPSSERLTDLARSRNVLRIAAEHRTHRTTQTLRETEGYRIGIRNQLLHVHAQGHGSVEDASPVQVQCNPVGSRQLPDRTHIVHHQHRSAAAIVRVLHANEPGGGEMLVWDPDRSFHRSQVNGAIRSIGQRAGMDASSRIMAINVDPDAPIFQIAHYKIVGDLQEVIPAMISELSGSAA